MDWVGNKNSIYRTLGASNHSELNREKDDYYATSPIAVEALLQNEKFSNNIWEPACGEGYISKVLIQNGYNVKSTDLIYRGFGEQKSIDFLKCDIKNFNGDIITNPPYKFAQEFVEKSLNTVADGHKVAMLLKLLFLEGKSRYNMFKKYPPKYVYVFSSRVCCPISGDFDKYSGLGGAVAYAWYVWEKGSTDEPIIRWIKIDNNKTNNSYKII